MIDEQIKEKDVEMRIHRKHLEEISIRKMNELLYNNNLSKLMINADKKLKDWALFQQNNYKIVISPLLTFNKDLYIALNTKFDMKLFENNNEIDSMSFEINFEEIK